MKDIRDYNLLNNNTFQIEETCHRFVEFDTEDQLQDVLRNLTEEDQPLLLLGGGSNLLLTKRFEGTVLHSAIKGVETEETEENTYVRCGSGEVFDDVVDQCVRSGWYGAENLSIIPGEVGASAVQNIGAYGREAKDIIYKIEAIEISTGKKVEFENEDCQYGYRQSKFKNEWKDKYVITYVTYKLEKQFTPYIEYGNIKSELDKRGIVSPTAQDVRNVIIDIRNAKLPDPKVEGNAGSFFMNPIVSKETFEQLLNEYPQMPHYHVDEENEKIPAGWLIDQCGWKGKTLGKAGVHDKQALVLVNKGGATGNDIVALCNAVREDVKSKFGVDIHPEVNFV